MDERSARLVQNEAIFHAGNDRIQAVVGDPESFEQVSLANAAHEAVRSHPARFVVVPGRENLTAGEVVVEESPHFAVVDNRGDEGDLVKRTDPRAGS
jgi:hypothetical protein